jgi:prefoldin alpha subunit
MSDEIQEKYMQFQTIQQHIEQITGHIQMLSEQAADIEKTRDSLMDLSNSKTGSTMLAPIANGIFVRAKLEDNEKLMLNVGSDTVVEKTIPQVIVLLEEQEDNLTNKLIEAQTIMDQLNQQATNLYAEIENQSVGKKE